jgi:PAS domain S-box-containing protein
VRIDTVFFATAQARAARDANRLVRARSPVHVRERRSADRAHGRRIYEYIFVPVIGDNGEVEAVAGTTRDVTERRVAEDAPRDSGQRLAEANRVKEFLAILSTSCGHR